MQLKDRRFKVIRLASGWAVVQIVDNVERRYPIVTGLTEDDALLVARKLSSIVDEIKEEFKHANQLINALKI